MNANDQSATDNPRYLRNILGNFPTGVAAIAAVDLQGNPTGMAVGTFSSVSLDPPLVSFMPAKSSTTYPVLAEASSFCVSFLGSDQEDVCRALSRKGTEKFRDVQWHPAPSGAPIIDNALAWIDCTFSQVHDAGDHWIVIGAVHHLAELRAAPPLVFFRGGYGAFSTGSLVAVAETDIIEPIRLAGRARPYMERLAQELQLECIAIGPVEQQTVSLAIADPTDPTYVPSRVGYRTPLVAPVGSVFVAWNSGNDRERWMPSDPSRAQSRHDALARVVERGWSVATGNHKYDRLERAIGEQLIETSDRSGPSVKTVMSELDEDAFDQPLEPEQYYDVRMLSAPVFAPKKVDLAISVRGFRSRLSGNEIEKIAERLVHTADEISKSIGGKDTLVQSASRAVTNAG